MKQQEQEPQKANGIKYQLGLIKGVQLKEFQTCKSASKESSTCVGLAPSVWTFYVPQKNIFESLSTVSAKIALIDEEEYQRQQEALNKQVQALKDLIANEVYWKNKKYLKAAPIDKLSSISWVEEGIISKNTGPARIDYYDNGKVRSIQYKKNQKLHREKGPAVIEFDQNGAVMRKVWYIDGDGVLGNKRRKAFYKEKFEQRSFENKVNKAFKESKGKSVKVSL